MNRRAKILHKLSFSPHVEKHLSKTDIDGLPALPVLNMNISSSYTIFLDGLCIVLFKKLAGVSGLDSESAAQQMAQHPCKRICT